MTDSVRDWNSIVEVFAPSAFSDTDFARSFRYGDEHYIHNADTADEQRYRADRRDEGCEHVDNSIKKVDISCHIYERIGVLAEIAVAGIEQVHCGAARGVEARNPDFAMI